MSGLSRLQNMFRVADLRNKILFTIFIIFVFRIGARKAKARGSSKKGAAACKEICRSIPAVG